jgi:hypothetical protein
MTAKDKAKELVEQMYCVEDPMGNYPMCFDNAKQCALIAVDEILLHEKLNHSVLDKNTDYWKDVKTEIEKL